VRLNVLDGVRIYFRNSDIVHIRPSGNAPQLRIYAVSSSQTRANEIVSRAVREPDGVLRELERTFT
jgi:phosphomannomutase